MNTKRSSMTKGGCVHTLLVRGSQHEVTYCSCGNVHVTWGSVTLRLLPEDFAVLSESLMGAAAALADVEVGGGIGAERAVGRLLV